MSEVYSTTDVGAKWLDDANKPDQKIGTRRFIFEQDSGHLLLKETGKEKSGSGTDSASKGNAPAEEKGTMPRHLERGSIPHARRITPRPEDRYILLKKFEGVITFRSAKSFIARLSENAGDYPTVEAEIDVEELSETDREKAVEGAPLVWTIGYRHEGSTRKRESAFYIRRLHPWTEKELKQSQDEVEELTSGIKWE